MEVDDWSISLVFELPDGSFHDEPRLYHARLDDALASARRDALVGAFGRTFRGFSRVEHANSGGSFSALPRATHVPTSPAQPLEDLLAKLKLGEALEERTAAEVPRVNVALEELSRLPWWDFEGAFGIATEVGVRLLRCASTDADEAEAAADLLGQLVAHQHQLFPVTSQALPWMVTLLEAKEVRCRRTLAQWLELITRSAVEGSDLGSKMLAWTARLVARELSAAMDSHQHAAKEVKQTMRTLAPRLEALRSDAEIGERVGLVLGLL